MAKCVGGFLRSFLLSAGTMLLCAAVPVHAADISGKASKSTRAAPQPMLTIEQTVIRKPLAVGVSFDDAVESLKLRANSLNFKLVAELPLSKQIEAMTDKKSRRMTIYQFCDALIAKEIVEHDINFAAYLPCRIAIIEDAQGKVWLVMMNIDLFMRFANLPPELMSKAILVRDTLQSIMDAGASGDF